MAKISAKQVKELRDMTGVGMMDAKNALTEVDGDMDKAVDFLREKGLAKAAKKADRIAAEGLAATYVDGNTAAIIEVNSETDFVAKNAEFQNYVKVIAEAVAKNKPADMDEALALEVDGQSIADLVTEATNKIGEKISFRRFELLEKSDDDAFGEYLHNGGLIAALTLVEGTTDSDLARDIAMHVAAINPRYVNRDEVPEDVYNKEEEIQKEIALNEGKPENIVEKMIKGRMNKFLSEISLTEQPFIKDGDQTVGQYAASKNGTVTKFVRYQVGEGMEKREEDFAAEVASQMK
ncbi:translation elongation factor Ts [Hutsoniella sourekii]